MKTFYTERDIEDMHAAGQRQIEVDDDVVLTDLAREKATALGLRLVPVEQRKRQAQQLLRAFGTHLPRPPEAAARSAPSSPPPVSPPKTEPGPPDPALVERVKAGVIARLGTTEYNGLLDQIIPQVLARLADGSQAATGRQRPAAKGDHY